jgi:outer membrane protein assembly factor BamA
MRVSPWILCLALAAGAAAGCKEEGTIQVHSLKFQGVKAVDEGQLKRALATHESSWIPWGRKYYFDRSRFDADLKRIQAFYADRGYPDARVTNFDVKLNSKQDQVDLTITIAEGEPVKVAAIEFVGFDESSGRSQEARAAQGRSAARSPARSHDARDGAQRVARPRIPVQQSLDE